MRVLHVGWGFSPFWSAGGLLAYTESVLAGQVRRGHDVSYLFGGRNYPLLRRPRLHRWRRDGVTMLEVLNGDTPAPSENGLRRPALDVEDAKTEALFARAIDRVTPQVLHVQTLGGLPSSLLDVARAAGIPTVVTLEDHHLLCPTLKLWDHTGQVCTRQTPGATCVLCCASGLNGTEHQRSMTRAIYTRPLRARPRSAFAAHIADGLRRRVPAPTEPTVPVADAAEYDRRRAANVDRLCGVDAILAMSPGVLEIFAARGVSRDKLRVQRLTLPHIEHLRARHRRADAGPVRFATLNGAASTEKGADVLIEAVERLDAAETTGRYRLHVHGLVADHAQARLAASPAVELRGRYRPADLETVLANADVGLVPSVWEEAYGYVGAEMVALGIPVISNRRGGLPFHTIPGRTGWLNDDADGAGLAAIMTELIGRPQLVAEMSTRVIANRAEVIRPFEEHLDELDAVYAEFLPTRSTARDLPTG